MKKVIPNDAILIPEGASCVFNGHIFDVYQWPQELYDGSEATFEMLKRADTTNVICIDEDKIIIIDDEQPNRGSLKTFPGGRIDPEDTDIQTGAAREVLEEIGYSFANWRLIKVEQPIRKIEWFVYLYVAWGKTDQTTPHHDPGEKITVRPVTFEELKDIVMSGDGYLGESAELFKDLHNVDDLMAIPEFQGKEVDR